MNDSTISSTKVDGARTAAILKIGGRRIQVRRADLLDEDRMDELDNELRQGQEHCNANVSRILELDHNERVVLIDLLAANMSKCTFSVEKKKYDDLLSATLACMVGPTDVNLCERGKRAALEVAAVAYRGAIEPVCNRIAQRMRELGLKGVRTDSLISQAHKIESELSAAAAAAAEGEPSGLSVRSILGDAPVPDDVVVPQGWELSPEEIRRVGGKKSDDGTPISAPVVVASRLTDKRQERELLELAWLRDGAWIRRVVERATLASTRDIVELAAYGLPVTSNNAKLLVQYISDFETANLASIPRHLVSRQLGWQGEDCSDGFLLGNELIAMTAADSGGVQFRGADAGDDQIADAFSTRGSLEEWISAVAQIADCSKILLALYSSFVPPLLPILGSDNFVVDFAGRTTTGKTTTMRLAASIWGNPDEQKPSSVLRTWDSTAVFRERMSAVLNNLPLLLDDTKHVRHAEDIAKTVYSVAQGVGRGRGTVKGLAEQGTWQTVLITSGEQPITSFTEDGGTRARVIPVWGSPFGATDGHTGELAAAINQAVKENFGHAGRQFLQFLVDNCENWPEWKAEYEDELTKFRQWAVEAENPFAGRMAPYFAAIATAAWLAHEALDLPWDYTDPIEPMWDELCRESGEANRHREALCCVMDWAVSHQAEFYGTAGSHSQPARGWAGVWKADFSMPDVKQTWSLLGFVPARLSEILRESGFEPESTIRGWQDEEWIMVSTDSDGSVRRTVRKRIGKENIRLICLKRVAVDQVCGI